MVRTQRPPFLQGGMQTAGGRKGNVLSTKLTWGISTATAQAPHLGASGGTAAHRGNFWEGVSPKSDLGSCLGGNPDFVLFVAQMWDVIPST